MTINQSCKHCCTKVENLSVTLNKKIILENINIHINCEEILAIIGPNGAGKSTLLKTILGEVPFTGKITFQFKGKKTNKPIIGYLPQRTFIQEDSPISVQDLLASAITTRPLWLGVTRDFKSIIEKNLAQVNADHLINTKLSHLSGGELQRVLLALSLINNPNLLLLDEPNTGIDAQGLSLFYKIVDNLRKKTDLSIIMVSHDLPGIANLADRIILLNKTIIADGTPKEIINNVAI